VRELSFVERLSLLVDQQWNWGENQAMARRLKSAKLRYNACIEDIDYRAARGLEKTVIRGLVKDSQWAQNHENLFVLGLTGVGKAISPVPSRRRRAATDTRRSIHGRRRCSAI
jgi:DNA replication protein DnaC